MKRLVVVAPDQRAAATAPPGPVLCVAPAGSGKTTTLVARICWLVGGGADPKRITAVTFNKRAAEELAERLSTALAPINGHGGLPRVRTFHALGREILAEAGVNVRNLQIDRSGDQVEITVEVVESGRQLRWHSAVVLRVPQARVTDAMLALAVRGFGDVMAYEANEGGR